MGQAGFDHYKRNLCGYFNQWRAGRRNGLRNIIKRTQLTSGPSIYLFRDFFFFTKYVFLLLLCKTNTGCFLIEICLNSPLYSYGDDCLLFVWFAPFCSSALCPHQAFLARGERRFFLQKNVLCLSLDLCLCFGLCFDLGLDLGLCRGLCLGLGLGLGLDLDPDRDAFVVPTALFQPRYQ